MLIGSSDAVGGSQSGVWTCGDNKFACTPLTCNSANFTVPDSKILRNAALLLDIGQPSTTTAATTAGGTATGSVATHSVTSSAMSIAEQCDAAAGGVSAAGAVGVGVGIGAPLTLATVGLMAMFLRERRIRMANERPGTDSKLPGV